MTGEQVEKRCFKCGETKAIGEFYRHPQMADGRLGKCKACTKSDVKIHYRDTLPGRKAYERKRAKTRHRRTMALSYQRTRRERHREKYLARNAVSNALRNGRLTKQPCKCGATKVQAHHHDYSRPLDVEWLCFRCHRNDRHGQHVEAQEE